MLRNWEGPEVSIPGTDQKDCSLWGLKNDDPFGLHQGLRPLASPNICACAEYSPVLELAFGLDPWRRPKVSRALGARM